jgi:hypothetical protein
MGTISSKTVPSKAARTLPKEKKPSWAGSRTPLKHDSTQETRRSMPSRPLAFENRTDGAYYARATMFASLTTCSNVVLAVEADAKDPQFMSKLSQLGPVRVDHHMRSVRPVRDQSSIYRMPHLLGYWVPHRQTTFSRCIVLVFSLKWRLYRHILPKIAYWPHH